MKWQIAINVVVLLIETAERRNSVSCLSQENSIDMTTPQCQLWKPEELKKDTL